MGKITVSGASDDLVEIEGKVCGCDEYGFYNVGKPGYVACSDGTVLRVCYGENDGCWRVTVEQAGTGTLTVVRKGDEDAETTDDWAPYSDVVTLEGPDLEDVRWVRKDRADALDWAKTRMDEYVARRASGNAPTLGGNESEQGAS